jgi:phage replication-related protein YjqB (UPF0714/DUF867 family)
MTTNTTGKIALTDALVEVSKARQQQNALLGSSEYCSLRPDVAETLGCEPGMQLRLTPVDRGRSATFTIYEVHGSDDKAEVRLAKKGRESLSITPSADVVISQIAPRTDLTRMQAFEQNELVETVWDDPNQDTLLVCAPHAGDMENNTAQAAGIVRKCLGENQASAYMLHGFGEDAFNRFHITTTDMDPECYPKLTSLSDRGFTHCLTFHLWNGDEVLLGGLADDPFRERLAGHLEDAIDGKRPIVTDHSSGKYMASTEQNLVNRLSADGRSGVQIEMPPIIALRYRKRVARALADFYDDETPE